MSQSRPYRSQDDFQRSPRAPPRPQAGQPQRSQTQPQRAQSLPQAPQSTTRLWRAQSQQQMAQNQPHGLQNQHQRAQCWPRITLNPPQRAQRPPEPFSWAQCHNYWTQDAAVSPQYPPYSPPVVQSRPGSHRSCFCHSGSSGYVNQAASGRFMPSHPGCSHHLPHPNVHYRQTSRPFPHYYQQRFSPQRPPQQRQKRPRQNALQGQQQQTEDKQEAEKIWTECVHKWYPDFHKQAYFIPPLYFNKVRYRVQEVAGQPVLVPQEASDQPREASACIASGAGSEDTLRASSQSAPGATVFQQPVACRMWPEHSISPELVELLDKVYDSDLRNDQALKQVLQYLEEVLVEREGEVMMVLAQLEFRKYLDHEGHPVSAAVVRLFPKPAVNEDSDGDFDKLMICPEHGLVVGEVKSVGADDAKTQDLDQAIVKRIKSAVRQLNRAEDMLKHMTSDVAPVRITKTVMLPNVTSTQVLQALGALDRGAQDVQAFCKCMGAPDLPAAVARCLCKDKMETSEWWQLTVKGRGPDRNMTPEVYETLVARFCGPATSVEVPTVTRPGRAVVRTMQEAVAFTGLRMAVLTLYPEQVQLLNDLTLWRVFLYGPPGTGKTVVLVLKALQWAYQGKNVHLLCTHRNSRAATMLIEKQVNHVLRKSSEKRSGRRGHVYVHMHEFENGRRGEVETAVNELSSAEQGRDLCVIADEAFNGCKFHNFCCDLVAKVPNVRLWAAAVMCEDKPHCLTGRLMTTPLRCPPAVVKEVELASDIDAGAIPRYTHSQIPYPTDGPKVREFQHTMSDSGTRVLLPHHSGQRPCDCKACGMEVAKLIKQKTHHTKKHPEGHPSQLDHDLEYRDVIILCHSPHECLSVVTCLQNDDIPVQVVTSDDEDNDVKRVALAMDDVVIVTDWRVVLGLERRVVVVMGEDVDNDRLLAMSRTTSLLVRVH